MLLKFTLEQKKTDFFSLIPPKPWVLIHWNWSFGKHLWVGKIETVKVPVQIAEREACRKFSCSKSLYNSAQNILGHLKKLGTKMLFAKVNHILQMLF